MAAGIKAAPTSTRQIHLSPSVQVVAIWLGNGEVITANEAGRQADAAAAFDHHHRQITAGADPFAQGASSRPGRPVVALGVAHPLLDDLDQLLQKAQALVVASDQGFLGQGNRERIVLAIGQPTL